MEMSELELIGYRRGIEFARESIARAISNPTLDHIRATQALGLLAGALAIELDEIDELERVE